MKVIGREIGQYVDKIHVLQALANVQGNVSIEDVERAEKKLQKLIDDGEARKATIITTHHYANGVYGREVFIPAGTFATGSEHKYEHLNILSKGEVTVLTESGFRRLTAPATFVSRAGMKRIGYAHSDVVWTTVHPNPTDETDFFKLERLLLVTSDEAQSIIPIEAPDDPHAQDRIDYASALSELGVFHEDVVAASESTHDLIDLPEEYSHRVGIYPSPISGLGVFSIRSILPAEVIAPARIGTSRTPIGRFTNHAKYPNCRFVVDEDGSVAMVSNHQIREGEELTVDYRHARQVGAEADSLTLNQMSPCPQ